MTARNVPVTPAFFSSPELNARHARTRVKRGGVPHGPTESSLMRSIRLAVNQIAGVRIWRNNVGYDGDHGVRYGLGVGSADLVGLVHGTFVALEVKTAKGRVTEDQTRWLETVRRFGGVAEVVRSVEEAVRVVTEVARGC